MKGMALGYAHAMMLTRVVVNATKRYVGYWRPYFYDECEFTDDNGSSEWNLPQAANANHSDFDVAALPALAVSYWKNGDDLEIQVGYTLIETDGANAGRYHRRLLKATSVAAYTEGDVEGQRA